jgi:hypothetical protein
MLSLMVKDVGDLLVQTVGCSCMKVDSNLSAIPRRTSVSLSRIGHQQLLPHHSPGYFSPLLSESCTSDPSSAEDISGLKLKSCRSRGTEVGSILPTFNTLTLCSTV